MDGPASETATKLESASMETGGDALPRVEEVPLQIAGDRGEGRKCSYSILLQGEVQTNSKLSSKEPEESITLLENNTKLLSGSVYGERVGFVVMGEVLAAEFDEPEPTVKLAGEVIDPGRWPSVKEYMGHGPQEESVTDPFPNSGEWGASPRDPLDPEEHVIELDAGDSEAPEAYCFDVDGQILNRPDGMTISEKGDRVYGYVHPGTSAQINVRGVIMRIETADGIDFSVRARGRQ